MHVTEKSTNMDVIRAIRGDNPIMMLGHGNKYGLFSLPDREGQYERLLVNSGHVQFLRDKTCIGIWCHANLFAGQYGLHGLFSGMIISELQEAKELDISTTEEEVYRERVRFAARLRDCISQHGLRETPLRMRELDDVHSELTRFNYGNLYYYE